MTKKILCMLLACILVIGSASALAVEKKPIETGKIIILKNRSTEVVMSAPIINAGLSGEALKNLSEDEMDAIITDYISGLSQTGSASEAEVCSHTPAFKTRQSANVPGYEWCWFVACECSKCGWVAQFFIV